ncbi:Nif3-like dinuclear metal center hexameric protein [Halomicrobium sp. LC1Hm]|uniref:Nif3-like dinuclear metal center hexameric protein n=1 Tax=Halomicrobium sp. LC1Hm TaxID=2610902 RepID=UPI0012985196|nr:Nif3-like dinuclear metal center hexameric protein [Halomicrobium sp. LC1Hm]QGA82041.1 GTP cyclohydrolase 1 type 2, NIF3 family [Halomicrobium sp. LC1Hm]
MELQTLTDRLDERLDTAAYADLDASPNGLQVETRSTEIEHVAVAVDAAEATVEAAADAGADLLITHHGIVWGGMERLTGTHYRRMAPLIEHGMGLYVSHLPLDGHPELGNAARLADLLELDDRTPFGEVGPEYIGQRGRAASSFTAEALRSSLADELDTAGQPVQVLDFGPDEIEDIAIVTGSGSDWIGEAAEAGVDALVTGEGKQKAYHEAREAGLTVVLAGHYATETVGVRSLAAVLEAWGLTTTYIDHPTGL